MFNLKDIAFIVSNESPNPVYVADINTYQIYYMNEIAHKLFGSPTEKELQEKKCYEILQARNFPCPFCTNHIIKKDKFYTWEYHNPVVDSYYRLQDKLIEYNGIAMRLEIAEDITEKVLLERKITNQLSEQNTLYNCIEILHHSKNADASIANILKVLGEFYNADRSYIFEFIKDGKYLRNSYEWCNTGVRAEMHNLQKLSFETAQRWFELFDTKGEVCIDNIENLDKKSEEYTMLLAQGISSLIAVPLRDENSNYIGFIGVDDPKVGTSETHVIRSSSAFITSFILNNSLLEQLYKLSFCDELTGLRNRNSFQNELNKIEEETTSSIGVIYIDIDGLKKANDTLGHKHGDMLVKRMGEILLTYFLKKAYRIGGDEFVVLYQNINEEDFKDVVQNFLSIMKNEPDLKVAIGANWSDNSGDIVKQVEEADDIMYIEKQKNKKALLTE